MESKPTRRHLKINPIYTERGSDDTYCGGVQQLVSFQLSWILRNVRRSMFTDISDRVGKRTGCLLQTLYNLRLNDVLEDFADTKKKYLADI